MRLKLLSPHVVPIGPNNDVLRPRGYVFEPPVGYEATPEMEGLDDEGKAAVVAARLKVWGRYWYPYGFYPPGFGGAQPLDDPPIPRPLDDNQPVFHYTGDPYWPASSNVGTVPGVVIGSPFTLDQSVLDGADVLV